MTVSPDRTTPEKGTIPFSGTQQGSFLPPRARPFREALPGFRPLLWREHLRNLPLQGDLADQLLTLSLDELLLQCVDLLIVRHVGQELGLELPVKLPCRRRPFASRTILLEDGLHLLALLLGQIGKPRETSRSPWTAWTAPSECGPAGPRPALPLFLRVCERKSGHRDERRNDSAEHPTFHICLRFD
jgi:hypothetical protein